MEQQLQVDVDAECRAIWRFPMRMMPSGDPAIGCARELSGQGARGAPGTFNPLLQLELAKEARLREGMQEPAADHPQIRVCASMSMSLWQNERDQGQTITG